MDKQELETKEKAFAASIVSVVYAFVIQLTQNLALIPNHPEIHVDASIFVPAIASILFGKLIGAAGAAGGQFVSSAGSSIITRTSSTASVPLTGLNLASLLNMVSSFVSAYVVGSLTEKPSVQWDSFMSRFTSLDTYSRLFQNTLGSVIGFGMVGSLLSQYSITLESGQGLDTATANFVQTFFLNSAILVIFIPITLLLYELGDVFVQVRAHAKDKSMRKLAKTPEKEDAVTIISARLLETALTQDSWTPVQVKFRAKLDGENVYKIEAISTANYYPAFDSTKPLKPGEIWEQKFFIMPAKQKNVDFKIRITPQLTNEADQENIKETIVDVKGKSYNPNSNSATLVLFSIINSIMVGASVVWNNLVTFSQSINQGIVHLQQSWVVVGSTTVLEVLIFVPVLMYLRRRWLKSDTESLTVGFGTDLSDRSQKVFQRFEGNVNQFLDYFGVKLQRSIRLFLVFVTTVIVLLLGIEGYNSIIEPKYSLTSAVSEQLLIIGTVAIVLWLGGYKGIDILKSTGIIGEEKYAISSGSVVTKFKPATDFISNTPNEVTFTITNPTEQKGIRFRFLSQDTVSPPLVEMPVPAGGSALFKTSITPIATGARNIMIVVYPLFDEKGNYIDENTAEPYSHQSVNFQVQSETQIGISKDQQSTLKKLMVFAGAIAAIVFGGGAFAQQLLGGVDLYNLISNNAPFLLVLQAPFVYAYFYLQNNSKVLKDDLESLIEQINTMDNIAKEMNTKLDKVLVKSTAFTKNIKTVVNTTMASMSGLSALKEINKMVTSQLKDSLGANFTDEISKVVQTQDLSMFTDSATKIISDDFSTDIQNTITKQAESYMPADGSKQLPADKKNDLKQEVKTKVKQDFGDKIKKQTANVISQELKSKSSDSLVNKYKTTIMANLKQQISKELKKEIKDGQLVNNIEDQVFEAIEPEIQKVILDQINNIVFNRDMLESIAEELDNSLGTTLISDFENVVGTDEENEITEKLKQLLNQKYEKEIMKRLENRIKKQINNELNKRGDQLIDDMLNSKLTDAIQDRLLTTLQNSLTNSLDTVVDKAIDTSIDTSVDALFSMNPIP